MTEFGNSLADFLKGKSQSATSPVATLESDLESDLVAAPDLELAPLPDAQAALPNLLPSEATPSAALQSQTTCPKCDAAMPTGTQLCEACGFHQGLNQQFGSLGQQTETVPARKSSWLGEQVGSGETPAAFMLAAACITPIAGVILFGLLYSIIGPWAFLVVLAIFAAVVVILAKVLGLRIGPQSLLLYFYRARGWRTLWPARKLKVLDMRDSLTTDADIASLKKNWELDVLDLENTQVTDAVTEHLAPLLGLSFLVLRGTQVSAVGLANIKQAMPDTRIWT